VSSSTLAGSIFGFDLGPVIFATVAGSGIGLLALPPWQDPKHPPAAGAAVLGVAALIALTAAWLLR
jgi:hypothetical protein